MGKTIVLNVKEIKFDKNVDCFKMDYTGRAKNNVICQLKFAFFLQRRSD